MITLKVPLPPRECSSNGSHGHWTKAANARRLYREECGWELTKAPVGSMATRYPRTVALTFCIKGGRAAGRYQPRDPSNAIAAFKAGFDAMVDMCLLVNDSAKWITLGAVEIDSKRGPFVEIRIEDNHDD